MGKHIIKLDKDTLPQVTYALAFGKQQAGIDPNDQSAQIIGDELHISDDLDTVYAVGLIIGTAIGLLSAQE